MAGGGGSIGNLDSTVDSPKVAKARLPPPIQSCVARCFFVPGGDIFGDRLVTYWKAARPQFIRKW